jgi:hypothetical protein
VSPTATDTRGPLHIVEPRLIDYAGHCHSLVDALVRRVPPDRPVVVWANRRCTAAWPGRAVRVERHFSGGLRRLQALWLYRRLVRGPGRVLVSTAGTTDLVLMRLAAAGRPIPPGKCFLLMHWLGGKARKADLLGKVAQAQPGLELLSVTPSVRDFFAACGFRSRAIPYPVAPGSAIVEAGAPSFRHLLVAGGARLDKGLDQVVAMVEALHARGDTRAIVVQVSAEAHRGHDEAVGALIARLRGCAHPGLKLLEESLTPEAYAALFEGAVVLQPYDPVAFADRVSGVTLDALRAGAPLVVSAGSWMARLVNAHRAGLTPAADAPVAEWIAAVDALVADYPAAARRSRAGGQALEAERAAAEVPGLFDDRAEA